MRKLLLVLAFAAFITPSLANDQLSTPPAEILEGIDSQIVELQKLRDQFTIDAKVVEAINSATTPLAPVTTAPDSISVWWDQLNDNKAHTEKLRSELNQWRKQAWKQMTQHENAESQRFNALDTRLSTIEANTNSLRTPMMFDITIPQSYSDDAALHCRIGRSYLDNYKKGPVRPITPSAANPGDYNDVKCRTTVHDFCARVGYHGDIRVYEFTILNENNSNYYDGYISRFVCQ